MTQQQYELFENTSVSAINALPGIHPSYTAYGALSLPEVSYFTNQHDNGPAPAGSTIAQFRFQGAPSHYLKDDPIVFPNQPGASHLHMFFGNTRADAYSEAGTGSQNDLQVRGASTVQGGKGANPSSYWMPAMVDGPLNACNSQRKIILPDVITVYYKSRRANELKEIPVGLELIGGNLPHTPGGPMVHGMQIKNSSGGSHREAAMWGFYSNGAIVDKSPTIPQTNPNGYKWLRCVIGFPLCFRDGPNGGFMLSSADHLSHQHMLEDAQGWNRDDIICPTSHPNRIPKVEILVDFRWPANGDVSGWRLSSDMGADTDAQVPYPGGSLHGDIMFAWNEKVQKGWKENCFDPNDPRNCSIGQTSTPWNLDRITNTGTITNQIYTGPTSNLSDPYDVCAPCPPAGTACDDNDPNTINDVYDGFCNCAGTYCPPTGTACDDNDPTTTNDVYDGACNCAGTACPTAGTMCDDNDPNTINDMFDGFCNCAGTFCPPAGTACNDNDPNTTNDVYDGSCNCAGTYCPPAGTVCDDNDPNTIDDQYDGFCSCIGTPFVPGSGVCQFDMPSLLDGIDSEWSSDSIFNLTNVLNGTVANQGDLNASFKLGWDDNYLYVFGKVTDDALVNDSASPWQDDSFELYLDGGNEKGTSYDANDYQLVFRYNDPIAYNVSGGVNNPVGVDFVMVPTNLGYNVEIRVSWAFIGVPPIAHGGKIGVDVHVNDDDDGGLRDKNISWNDLQGLAYTNPSMFGEVLFEDCQSSFITTNICLWLEGAYDVSNSQMTTDLTQLNLLPLAQPYNTPPWNYTGTEKVTNLPVQAVDWVKVSFRTDPSKSSEVLATAALLQEDGCLFFTEAGFFPESLGSSFYVVVEHRNHIGVMSPTAIVVDQGTLSYDFRSGDSYTNGASGQKELVSGVWGLFAGDGDQLLDVNGYDINAQDNSSWAPQNGGFNVYGLADYNLDGDVSGLDKILWSINNGVYSTLDR